MNDTTKAEVIAGIHIKQINPINTIQPRMDREGGRAIKIQRSMSGDGTDDLNLSKGSDSVSFALREMGSLIENEKDRHKHMQWETLTEKEGARS